MKAQIAIDADVRHIYAAMTLCAVFDGFYKETDNREQDNLEGDVVPALLTLLIILRGAPEGYGHAESIETWARAAPGNDARLLIAQLREMADRMEKAIL